MKMGLVASLVFVSMVRAQDVAPPPKPADKGPSLEVTMKYIQDRLNGQGAVSYSYIETYSKILQPNNPSRDQESQRVFGAVADAAKCTLSWRIAKHYHSDYYHKDEDSESKGVLSFRDTAKLVVEPYPGWPLPLDDIQPPVLQLRVVLNADKGSDWFLFREEETAGRLAKAMVHAVELCGGGDKDLFKWQKIDSSLACSFFPLSARRMFRRPRSPRTTTARLSSSR